MARRPRGTRPVSRRGFLCRATGLCALGALPAPERAAAGGQAVSPPPLGAGEGDDRLALRQLLADPPQAAKPLTRWWWFGGAVTPEEITRELGFMKEAGLRGAEIQPVYPIAVDDPGRGIRNLRYYSPEWLALLRHAATEARRLELQLDFTLGSGWPYGGPFVPTSLAARRLRVLEQDAAGPADFFWDLAPQLTGDDRLVSIVMAPLRPNATLDLGRAHVLADETPSGSEPGGRPRSVVRARVEEGLWRILAFLDSPTGQLVKRPTLGMEGYVLDHHRREAMALFLRAAGDRVLDALGEAPFHSVFCDSLEVYGADWTADLLAEFEKRRGYDLRPFLPALFHETGEEAPHVRHDVRLTLSDLNLEYFFAPLVAWAEKRGVKARIQAHGAPGDVMRAYGLAHIPEGENIFGGDRYQVNLRHRRLASSAAHLYGRPLASSETYTWLRTPLFVTTLERMKPATDAVLLDGLNHIVNHGYSYSPPEAGEPGWAFYASTEANHTNTWWRHYPHLARYVQRVCALLQRGAAVNPVAVYLPLSDLFAQKGAGSLHVDVEAETLLDAGLFRGLRQGGYDFDVVHDHALLALARIEGDVLAAGTGRYRVVVVPGARYMPPESASRLVDLVRAGGHVIFVGGLPQGAAGRTAREARSEAVRRALVGLWGHDPAPDEVERTGVGSAVVVADTAAALARVAAVLPPDFRIVEPALGPARSAAVENVGFVHRREGAVDLYFVANVSDDAHDLRVRFAVGHRSPERWSPETGDTFSPVVYEYRDDERERTTEVELHLDPLESCFVVFGAARVEPLVTAAAWPGLRRLTRSGARFEGEGVATAGGEQVLTLASGKPLRFRVRELPAPIGLEGPWTLALGAGAKANLVSLVSWTSLPQGRTFSGWGVYVTEFEMGALEPDLEWSLDLGAVHETAEAALNDQPLGAAWKGRRRLGCGAALRAGRNRLRVEVANLWIHDVISRPAPDLRAMEETYGVRWGLYGETRPESLPPAGLLGPVRLVPARRVAFRA